MFGGPLQFKEKFSLNCEIIEIFLKVLFFLGNNIFPFRTLSTVLYLAHKRIVAEGCQRPVVLKLHGICSNVDLRDQ